MLPPDLQRIEHIREYCDSIEKRFKDTVNPSISSIVILITSDPSLSVSSK